MRTLSNVLRGALQNPISARAVPIFATNKYLNKYQNNDSSDHLENAHYNLTAINGSSIVASSRQFSTNTDVRFFSYDSPVGTKNVIDVTNDYVFKNIFKHKEIITNFLENVLIGDKKILPSNSVIEDLEFLPNEYIQDKIPEESKRTIFDLQIKTNEGIFIVEMQKGAKPEYLQRIEFYSAIAYSSQPIKKGPYIKMKEYVNAKPVVTISILDEESGKNIFDPEVPCISYHINTEQKTGKQYMKALSHVFIDLKKFDDQEDMAEDMQDWLRLFTKQDLNYNYHNEQVKNAIKYINDIIDNNYDAYLRHSLTEQIQETEKHDARAEGKAEGKFEGKAEGKAEGISVALKYAPDANLQEDFNITQEQEDKIKQLEKQPPDALDVEKILLSDWDIEKLDQQQNTELLGTDSNDEGHDS